MNKRELISGMALGAAIAFGGMLLGGQAPHPGDANLEDANFRVLTCREFHVRNVRGDTLCRITARGPQPEIRLMNQNKQNLVRVSSVLAGGGTVVLYENNSPQITMSTVPAGGILEVKNNAGEKTEPAVRITGDQRGGTVTMYDPAGNPSHELPRDLP